MSYVRRTSDVGGHPYQSAASLQVVEDTARTLDKGWEEIQKKTFTKWVNTKLALRDLPPIENIASDLSDGRSLLPLLEIIGEHTFSKYNKQPKIRIQKVENANMALQFLKHRGLQLTNIGPEDIVDSNPKLILGLIWTIILRFTIADINEEGLTAKEGLLLWCQRKTAPYKPAVDIKDFTFSWQDGLGFCALIHRHRPDLLNFDALNKSDRQGNTRLAFEIAEKHLNIPRLLDVEDVCDVVKPDERSIMTYVAQYFHAFSASDKVETAGRRVAKFAELIQSTWEMQHAYETRVTQLIQSMSNIQSVWASARFDETYTDAKRQSNQFVSYKATEKRQWVAEKRELDALLGNIQIKLKTYNLAPYQPPAHLTLQELDKAWSYLIVQEGERRKVINAKIREIKENLRVAFAQQANDFNTRVNTISKALASVDGELQNQLDRVQTLQQELNNYGALLQQIKAIDDQCNEANIEENDYTVFSLDDLQFDFTLVSQALQKKSAFLQNQMVSRNLTNLTPGQIEEFESTFRHFDRDHTNTLGMLEFKAALAGLGEVYTDAEFDRIFRSVAQGTDRVTFEQFINYVISVSKDETTPEQLRQSFRTVAGDKPYVSENDFRMCHIPQPVIQHLAQTMPRSGDGFDYGKYLDTAFSH